MLCPEGSLAGLREKGQVVMDQMSNQTTWSYGKDVPIENKENIDHIQGVMEDMQLRKQRFAQMYFFLSVQGCSCSR